MSKGCLKCGRANADDASVCLGCGTPLSMLFAATQTPTAARVPSKQLLIGIGALVVALVAGGGVWWAAHSHATAVPTFDSAPPPSMAVASGPAESGAAPATASPPASNLWEPIAKNQAPPEAADTQRQAARDEAARDAKAHAKREQRAQAASQAQAALTRRRTEDARARGARPAPASAAAALSNPSSAVPPPTHARKVQERCANRNPLLQGICESRECVRAENADERVCQRIKAADDRRRDP